MISLGRGGCKHLPPFGTFLIWHQTHPAGPPDSGGWTKWLLQNTLMRPHSLPGRTGAIVRLVPVEASPWRFHHRIDTSPRQFRHYDSRLQTPDSRLMHMARAGFPTSVRLLTIAATLGCGHTEPFSAPPFDRNQPFDPSPPVRLTLNRGPDRRPAWLPDASGILYSTQLVGTRESDVCLGRLPASGGSQQQLTCALTPNSINLTDALESAAPATDGRLAFVAATSNIGAGGPDAQSIALATVGDPATQQSLHSVPYSIPGGRLHTGVSQIRWLGPNRLVFLGEAVTVLRPCPLCPIDTLRSGLDAVWLEVNEAPPVVLHAIAGTDYASGVSPGATEDEVYYTLNGDARVYRKQLSTGDVTVAHDFGAAGFARDVHVVGDRMAAVVGGRVAFAVDSSLGPTQWDSGGLVHLVNLQDGSDMILDAPGPGLSRRPQLSPSGSAVVAEVYPLLIGLGPTTDTTVSKVGDLFTYGQP